MSDHVADLVLKAVRLLPPEEQDEVLSALIGRAIDRSPALTAAGLATAVPGVDLPGLDLPAAAASAVPTVRRFGLRLGPAAGASPDPETDTALKMLPVRLPGTDYERLRAFSREHGFSMAVIVRTLVERFLDGQARRWSSARDVPADDPDETDGETQAGHA